MFAICAPTPFSCEERRSPSWVIRVLSDRCVRKSFSELNISSENKNVIHDGHRTLNSAYSLQTPFKDWLLPEAIQLFHVIQCYRLELGNCISAQLAALEIVLLRRDRADNIRRVLLDCFILLFERSNFVWSAWREAKYTCSVNFPPSLDEASLIRPYRPYSPCRGTSGEARFYAVRVERQEVGTYRLLKPVCRRIWQKMH